MQQPAPVPHAPEQRTVTVTRYRDMRQITTYTVTLPAEQVPTQDQLRDDPLVFGQFDQVVCDTGTIVDQDYADADDDDLHLTIEQPQPTRVAGGER